MFFIFRFSEYYPTGGTNDLAGSGKTKEEIVKIYLQSQSPYDVFNVLDGTTGKIYTIEEFLLTKESK